MEVLKVSAKSNPNSVAGALAGVLRERGAAEIRIGPVPDQRKLRARGFAFSIIVCLYRFFYILMKKNELRLLLVQQVAKRKHLRCFYRKNGEGEREAVKTNFLTK